MHGYSLTRRLFKKAVQQGCSERQKVIPGLLIDLLLG
jgi:hypothetical protein